MSHPDYVNIGTPMTKVIEECSELIQSLCKVDRFGWFNHHPETKVVNIDQVESEMNDVVEAIEKLEVQIRQIKHDHFKRMREKNENI